MLSCNNLNFFKLNNRFSIDFFNAIFSTVTNSNESLESVTQKAQDADENVARSEDLIKIFGSTLKMVNFSPFSNFTYSIHFFYSIRHVIIIDIQFGSNADVKCCQTQAIYGDTHCSILYG